MKTLIIIRDLALCPSLNIALKEHFAKRKKRKTNLEWEIKSQTKNKHKGKVRITYTRYGSRFLDWDNLGGSFKSLGDALISTGVIIEDNPNVVIDFKMRQLRVSRKEVKLTVEVEDYV